MCNRTNYGMISNSEIEKQVDLICRCLGTANGNAKKLVIETAVA